MRPSITANKDQRWAWKSVFGGFVSCAIFITVDLSCSILYKEIKSFYNVNSTIASTLFGLIQSTRLLLSPIVIVAIGTFGCDKVSISGGVIISVALFISSCSSNIVVFTISYGILAGSGMSFCHTSLLVILSENFHKKKSLAYGIALSGISFGYIIFPHFFALILDHYDFKSALMILSSFTLNLVIPGLFYRKPRNIGPLKPYEGDMETELMVNDGPKIYDHTEIIKTNRIIDRMKKMGNRNVIIFTIGICWYILGVIPWSIFIVDFINSVQEMSLKIAVLTFTMEGVAQILSRILSGYMFDTRYLRPYRGFALSICSFLTGFCCIVLVLISPSIHSYLVISTLRGFCLGVFVTQNNVVLGDYTDSEVISMAIGMLTFAKGIGSIIGSIISGFVHDNFPSYLETFIFLGLNQIFASVLLLIPFVLNFHRKLS